MTDKRVTDLTVEDFQALITQAVEGELVKKSEKRVTDMTVEELRALITQVVDERLILWLQPPHPKDARSLEEIMESVDRHRWTPPPGTPTGSEIIIAERERWRQPM